MTTSSVALSHLPAFVEDACLALGWSQRELSRRSGVPQTAISRFRHGQLGSIDLDQLARVVSALGVRIEVSIEAPFLVDRARQRDRVHARCIGYVGGRLLRSGWEVASEVEVMGSRGSGWIDVLAYDSPSRTLLVIEVKTELDDLGRVQRTLAWYERTSWDAARHLGWRPRHSMGVLLVLATQAVDTRLRENREVVHIGFPGPVAALRGLIAAPASAVDRRRSLALIDPLSRSRQWVRASTADRRAAPSPHRDYAEVARRLEALHRPGPGSRGG